MKNYIFLFLLILTFGCSDNNDTADNILISFTGDVFLTSQQEIDDFGNNGYERIIGSLRIRDLSNDITDLSALSQILVIDYDFRVASCNNLQAINLLNIERVDTFTISNNPNLTNFNFTNLKGNISFFNLELNDLLTTFNIPQLNHIDDFNIRENSSLSSYNLLNLNSVERILISGNDSLESLSGIDNLSNISYLIIQDNLNLININQLGNVSSTIDYMAINDNDSLITIEGLSSSNIDVIQIINNDVLQDLNGLVGSSGHITSIDIANNDLITNINGLSNIISTEYYVRIINNESISNLNGISNLNDALEVSIENNSSLSDFCGLTNILGNSSFDGSYQSLGNLINPTQEQIINGNCN